MAKKRPKINLGQTPPAKRSEIEALFTAETDAEQAAGAELRAVRLDAIESDPDQPRQSISEEHLSELSESIRLDGVIQPIEIVQIGRNKYRLIHGERRWRAAKMAGLKTIPAIVRRSDYDDLTRLVRQLVENIQREDLNDIDRAAGLLRLREFMEDGQVDTGGGGRPKTSWAKVGARLGYTRQRIHQLIQLLKLPDEIKEAVRQGTLSERETRVYQGLPPRLQSDLHSIRIERELPNPIVKRLADCLKAKRAKSVARALELVENDLDRQPAPKTSSFRPILKRVNSQLTRLRIEELDSAESDDTLQLLQTIRAQIDTLIDNLEHA